MIELIPSLITGGSITALLDEVLHEECRGILNRVQESWPGQERQLQRHQREAIEIASLGGGFVVTLGTGSGQSFGSIIPILTRHDSRGQKVIGDAQGLKFLVLDQGHTHRGRQGAAVARRGRET